MFFVEGTFRKDHRSLVWSGSAILLLQIRWAEPLVCYAHWTKQKNTTTKETNKRYVITTVHLSSLARQSKLQYTAPTQGWVMQVGVKQNIIKQDRGYILFKTRQFLLALHLHAYLHFEELHESSGCWIQQPSPLYLYPPTWPLLMGLLNGPSAWFKMALDDGC